MEIDVSKIQKLPEIISSTIDDVSAAYDSEWDDPVHDSYRLYIDESKQQIEAIVEAINSISAIQSECESIDIDAIRSEYESIAEEVSAL